MFLKFRPSSFLGGYTPFMEKLAAAAKQSNLIDPFSPDTILSTVLESTAEGMVVVDTDLNVRYYNGACEPIFGENHEVIPLAEWRDKFFLHRIDSDDPLTMEEYPIFRLLSGQDVSDLKTRLEIVGDSREHYISWNGKPLRRNGEIIGGVLSLTDIRERIEHDRELRAQRNFFKVTLDFIPALIYVRNVAGELIFTNATFDIYLSELKRRPKHEENLRLLLEMLQRFDHEIKDDKLERRFRSEFPTENGETRVFQTVQFPIVDERGEIQYLAAIAFDETLKEEEKKLLLSERTKNMSVSRLAHIGTLASEIGHEINGPLTVIKSISFLLQEMLKSQTVHPDFIISKIAAINETVDRIYEISNSLRNYSRKTSREKKDRCQISEILKDVIPLVSLKFRRHNIKLILDPSTQESIQTINCWRTELSQVLFNLLMNGADAVEKVPAPWVKLEFTQDDEFVYARVSDNGPGIPPEIRKEIFDQFFTTKAVGKGTGLGLSISKNIVVAHGGEIYLEEGPHTTFVVKLPK